MTETKTTPRLLNVRSAKEFFSSSLKGIFSPHMGMQSRYSAGDIVNVLRNAVTLNEYVETYVRNNRSKHTPSADTVFRRIHGIASEPGSHRRKGSPGLKRETDHSGTGTISGLIDRTVKDAMTMGAFMQPVNVAIDEHDQPYYGMDNRYLINAPFHKFRGTDKAYRFGTLESVKKGERFSLSIIRKDPLDGIDNASEVDSLLRHAISLGIKIKMVLMDRGYLDVGVMNKVASLNLEYIIPAKDNPKVLRFKQMEMVHSDAGFAFLAVRDTITSGKENANANFVHVVYYPGGRKHDFAFYTNAGVTGDNVRKLAEAYRERWGIENGYLEKKDTKEKTHSPEMGIRYFLFFLSVLLYNLWILLNIIRRLSGYSWITLMDFLIAMGRGRWRDIMNDHG